MSRRVNESGIIFVASTLKTLFFAALCFAFCFYATYKLWSMGAPMETVSGSRTLAGLICLAGLSGILFLINFTIVLWEGGVSIKMDGEKIIYRFLWLRHEWKWADIDRLHLQAPQPPSSIFGIFWLVIVALSKILPLGKTELCFQDCAYEEKRTRRWTLRPKKDGFVAIPLGYFPEPDEVFDAAQRYHTGWLKLKSPKNT